MAVFVLRCLHVFCIDVKEQQACCCPSVSRIPVAVNGVPTRGSLRAVAKLNSVLSDARILTQASNGVIENGDVSVLAVHDDPALLVVVHRVAGNGACDCACRVVSIVIDGIAVLGTGEREVSRYREYWC